MSDSLPVMRFFGRMSENSGYGNAVANIGLALSDSSINTDFNGVTGKHSVRSDLNNYVGETSVDLCVQTPPFSKHISKNYKIGYFYWETDKLPGFWAKDIVRSLDELWVPCDLTKGACLRAGFAGPIEVLHTPYNEFVKPSSVQIPAPISRNLMLSSGTYKFYSVFQWNERKGYSDLVRAYYREFDYEEDVVLILKVNPISIPGHGLPRIKADILALGQRSGKRRLPKIFLITNMLPKEDVLGLHILGDTFVLPHYGEGWGMPIHDAMMHGSDIITTRFGGITELLNDKNANIIKHKEVNVSGMSWAKKLYTADQKWAKPNSQHLRVLMRRSFSRTDDNRAEKILNSKIIAKSLSVESCALKMEEILSKDRFRRFL